MVDFVFSHQRTHTDRKKSVEWTLNEKREEPKTKGTMKISTLPNKIITLTYQLLVQNKITIFLGHLSLARKVAVCTYIYGH